MHTYSWTWEQHPVVIAYDTIGSGDRVLSLPALSNVPSREAIAGVAEQSAFQFQVTTIDMPGLSESSRLPLTYTPELYRHFLQVFVPYTDMNFIQA